MLALGATQRELEVVEQQQPVGQPGQGVVQRLVVELALEARALDRVVHGAADQPAVALGLEQVVLRAGLDGLQPDDLVLERGEHDDRHARRDLAQRADRLDTAAVG